MSRPIRKALHPPRPATPERPASTCLQEWEHHLLREMVVVVRQQHPDGMLRSAFTALNEAHRAVCDGASNALQARHLRAAHARFGTLTSHHQLSIIAPPAYLLVASGLYLLARLAVSPFDGPDVGRHLLRSAAHFALSTEPRAPEQSPTDVLFQDFFLAHLVTHYAQPWETLHLHPAPLAALARATARIGMVSALVQWPARGLAMPSLPNAFFALYPFNTPVASNDLDSGALFATATTWTLAPTSDYFACARRGRPLPLGDVELTLALMMDNCAGQAVDISHAVHLAYPDHPLLALAYDQGLAHYNRDCEGDTSAVRMLATAALPYTPGTARTALTLPRLLALATTPRN